MSKELEAFKRIKLCSIYDYDEIKEDTKIVETALEEHDLLKRSLNRNWVEVVNDEKKLKALETLKSIITIDFEREVGNDLVCVGISGVSKIDKTTLKELKEVLL